MSSKDEILGAVRKGLKAYQVPMPYPAIENSTENAFFGPTKDIVEHFAENFIQLGGKFAYCANESEMLDLVHTLAIERHWSEVYIADPILIKFFENESLPYVKTGKVPSFLDASVTLCNKVVARLGSIVLSSDAGHGRSLPVYTPIHIAIAYADQVVWDIKDAFDPLANTINIPSQITLTTGPSRTADIEKTLVVGVHGPKEVFVFYIDKPMPK